MTEPWFNPLYSWLPGTILGVLAGLWGTLLGVLGPRGKAKSVVVGLFYVLLIASIALLLAGILAFATGQPYGIWYGLGLAGLIGCFVLGFNSMTVMRIYRMAEERRMKAQDL